MITTYEGALECSSSSLEWLVFMVGKDVKKCLSELQASKHAQGARSPLPFMLGRG